MSLGKPQQASASALAQPSVRSPAQSAALSTSPNPKIKLDNLRIELDSFGRVSGISVLDTNQPIDLGTDSTGREIQLEELSIIPTKDGKSTLFYSPPGRVATPLAGFLTNSEVHEPAKDRTKMQVSAIDEAGVQKSTGQEYQREFPSEARELASQIMDRVLEPAREKFEEQEQKIEDRAPPPSLSSEENRSSVKWGVGLIVIGVLCMGLGPLAPVGIALVAVGAFMLAGPAMDAAKNVVHGVGELKDWLRPSEADMAAKMTKDALQTPEVRAQLEKFGLNPKDIEAMLGGDKGIKSQVKANGLETLPPSYAQTMREPSQPLPPRDPDSSLQPAGPVPPPRGPHPASRPTDKQCLVAGWRAMNIEFGELVPGVSDKLRADVQRLGAFALNEDSAYARQAAGVIVSAHDTELQGVKRFIDNRLIELGGKEMGLEVRPGAPEDLIKYLHQLGGAIARHDEVGHIEELKAGIREKQGLEDERDSVYEESPVRTPRESFDSMYEEPLQGGNPYYSPRTSHGHSASLDEGDLYVVPSHLPMDPSQLQPNQAPKHSPLGHGGHGGHDDHDDGYLDMEVSEEAPSMHAQPNGIPPVSSPLAPASSTLAVHPQATGVPGLHEQQPFGQEHPAGQPNSLHLPAGHGHGSHLAAPSPAPASAPANPQHAAELHAAKGPGGVGGP